MTKPSMAAVAVLVSVALISGCGKTRKEYERQLEICTVGEKNGVLTAAAEACGKALDIARQHDYTPEEISDLSYRLGLIERQQGKFEEAEALVQTSLDYELQVGDSAGIASRLVELAVSVAGQNRWRDGAELLTRAEAHVQSLGGSERRDAMHAFRGYAAQLRKLGDSETAARFTSLAEELATE